MPASPSAPPPDGPASPWLLLDQDPSLNSPLPPGAAGRAARGDDLSLNIGWDRFEKLVLAICRRVLGSREIKVRRYGMPGQAQHGIELLDEDSPFEIDRQAAHLFKHPYLGIDDVMEMWNSDPLFYPAQPPAHWLMVAEVAGRILMAPLAPSRSGDPRRCRPIGCYVAADHLAKRYKEDR